MRVQPLWPSRPLTTITMRMAGSAVVACSAASRPAPPAPTTRMSQSRSSIGNTFRLGWRQVRVADERVDAPVCDDQADNEEDRGHGIAIRRGDPSDVEDDVPQAVQPVV